MYTIVDTASDDVVAWSKAGDSFIVRQVPAALFPGPLRPILHTHARGPAAAAAVREKK